MVCVSSVLEDCCVPTGSISHPSGWSEKFEENFSWEPKRTWCPQLHFQNNESISSSRSSIHQHHKFQRSPHWSICWNFNDVKTIQEMLHWFNDLKFISSFPDGRILPEDFNCITNSDIQLKCLIFWADKIKFFFCMFCPNMKLTTPLYLSSEIWLFNIRLS